MDIKLKDFEGPLDLLLHLVSKYEMDIYDVPLVEVIEQYLAYLAGLTALRLEVAGEYMVMASQLMLIKSRKLLPKLVTVEEMGDDPEDLLISQLEEYARFKAISQNLADQHAHRAQFFTKAKEELIVEDATLKHDKTGLDIFLTFSKVMAKKQESIKTGHTVIEREDFRIEDMMQRVEERLPLEGQLSLTCLFEETRSVNELVTLFLAVLELIKVHKVYVQQQEVFGEISLGRELS